MRGKKKGRRLLAGLLLAAVAAALCRASAGAADPPVLSAESAILVEAETGRVLVAQNAHEERAMASTTKIMTALIALEQPELDSYFTVDAEAIRVEGSSMGLREGDRVTLRTLAAGMLLASGNDAANAAAVRIGRMIPWFVEMMNARAAELGMTQTHFETPSGLDGEEHYSTAYDLALLARAAIANDDFLALCSAERLQLRYGNPPYDRWLSNHNKLLAHYEGTIGVKTGYTKKAGRCLVSACEREGVTLIAVTLDAPDDWNDHMALYDYGFSQLTRTSLAPPQRSWELPVAGGCSDRVTVAVGEGMEAWLLPSDLTRIETVVELPRFLYAPVASRQTVGRVRYLVEGVLVAEQPIRAAEEVEAAHRPSLWERLCGWFGRMVGGDEDELRRGAGDG